MYHATLTVLRFELVRTFTRGRIAIWLMLCVFPSALVALLRSESGDDVPDDALAIICYALVPQISCMLGLLLWATPAIGTELESQTWIYLTVRRHGRAGIAIGKYIVAAVWTASYGIISAVGVSALSGVEHPMRLAACLIALFLLASLSYAALYLFIGAAFYRRATVIAVVYSLLLEGLVSWVPATVNKFTVSYRLRSLLANWMELDRVTSLENMNLFFGSEPAWQNVLALFVYAGVFLLIAVYVVLRREYPVQVEA